MIDERSTVEKSELSEQHCVHEWHRGQLLQVHLHREFVLLLLHHEGHVTKTDFTFTTSRLIVVKFDRRTFTILQLLTRKSSMIFTSKQRTRYTARARKVEIVRQMRPFNVVLSPIATSRVSRRDTVSPIT